MLGSEITKKKPAGAEKYGYLEWVAIHPHHQRLGVGICMLGIKSNCVGTKLVSIVVDKMLALGVRSFSADTGADNRPAICFLEKLGFGDRKAHVYMSKTLQQVVTGATPESRRSEQRGASEHRGKRASSVERSGTEKRARHHGDGSGVIVREMQLDDIYPVFQLGERVCGIQLPF